MRQSGRSGARRFSPPPRRGLPDCSRELLDDFRPAKSRSAGRQAIGGACPVRHGCRPRRPLPMPSQSAKSTRDAPVAQLDRALPSEGKGHTFESCRVRHLNRRCSSAFSRLQFTNRSVRCLDVAFRPVVDFVLAACATVVDEHIVFYIEKGPSAVRKKYRPLPNESGAPLQKQGESFLTKRYAFGWSAARRCIGPYATVPSRCDASPSIVTLSR
jgi:hypothetical protein